MYKYHYTVEQYHRRISNEHTYLYELRPGHNSFGIPFFRFAKVKQPSFRG